MTAQSSQYATVDTQAKNYFSSDTGQGNWGQPSASSYIFNQVGNRLVGHLIRAQQTALGSSGLRQFDPLLSLELKAWEAASDEDLLAFELRLA